jgi:hypothetical protein
VTQTMNILTRCGDGSRINLTIVNGSHIEKGESPIADTLAMRVNNVLFANKMQIESWEAIAHVASTEKFLGRECDEDEIIDLVCHVMVTKAAYEELQMALAGRGAVLPFQHEAGYFGNDYSSKAEILRGYERDHSQVKRKRAQVAERGVAA